MDGRTAVLAKQELQWAMNGNGVKVSVERREFGDVLNHGVRIRVERRAASTEEGQGSKSPEEQGGSSLSQAQSALETGNIGPSGPGGRRATEKWD